MNPGPIDFRGPMRGLMGFGGGHYRARWLQGAQQRAHRNDTEKSACGRPKTFFFCFFLFGHHLKILRKRWHFSLKTFFAFVFGDHLEIRTKLWHFSHLFWRSQNRKSVTFKLAPGPRSALGAHACKKNCTSITSSAIQPFRSRLKCRIYMQAIFTE